MSDQGRRLGVVGLGRMGRAMAERLLEAGQDLTVWSRSPERAEGLAVRAVSSPTDLAAGVDVVLSVLRDQAAIADVYGGAGGLLSRDLSGVLIVEVCTMSPTQSRALGARVAAAGGHFLECPVGGTLGPARQGRLLGLAGGTAADFAVARDVLSPLMRRLEHVGKLGAGAAMKLSINLPLMVYWSALGEALGLARAGGVEPGLALDILADSSGAIGAAKARVPPIAAFLATGEAGGANFALETALKDMGEMVGLAERHGLSHEVISGAMARAERARAAGWGARDASLTAAFDNLS